MKVVKQLEELFNCMVEGMGLDEAVDVGREVTVRMPMIQKNKKGIRGQMYATYKGHEGKMKDWVKRDSKLRSVYYLRGAKGNAFTLKIMKNGEYSMWSSKSSRRPIAFGTMNDKYIPEIIVK